jgi:predicted ATPase
MITKIWLKDYRSFDETAVTLDPLTVLVGRNGAGKSNLLKALKLVKDAMTFGLDVAMLRQGGLEAFRRWQKRGRPFDVGIGLNLKTETVQATYKIVLGNTSTGPVKEEVCKFQRDGLNDGFEIRVVEGRKQWISHPKDISAPSESKYLMLPLLGGHPGFEEVYKALSQMSFYTILPNLLQEPQKPLDDYPLDEEGRNLVSVLRALRDDQRRGLNEALFRIVGDVEHYEVEKSGTRLVAHLHHKTEDNGPDFELSQESDGTLRVLAILTALYQRPARPLIALEEPELTIHPGAMGILWEEIEKASQRSQIIVTTHSPDLLDMCDVEQIRVVEKEDGITHVGLVDEEQRAIVRQRLFAPGELLRAQGLERASEA